MKKYKVVYKAVRKVILTAHMEDGASMADIVKETDEQKKEGRIRYLVVAEEKRAGQREQEEQSNVGTRGSRDAEGGRSQRVRKGKEAASTAEQEGMGGQETREVEAATDGACTSSPGSATRTVRSWLPNPHSASHRRRR